MKYAGFFLFVANSAISSHFKFPATAFCFFFSLRHGTLISKILHIGGKKMIQKFIELGQGYSDVYELLEIAKNNQHRLSQMMAFHSNNNGKEVTSLAVILHPTNPGDFQPLYICREGIPNPHVKPNKRFDLFAETAEQLQKEVIELTVKPSSEFVDIELYYQYLIGILRMNRYIPFWT
jgi:hypothetical protein